MICWPRSQLVDGVKYYWEVKWEKVWALFRGFREMGIIADTEKNGFSRVVEKKMWLKKIEKETMKWEVSTTHFGNGDASGPEEQKGVLGRKHRFLEGQIYFKVGAIIACLYTDGTVHSRERKCGNVGQNGWWKEQSPWIGEKQSEDNYDNFPSSLL